MNVIPDDVAYAHIVNGILQVTPDIEEEIAGMERGETVSMAEFFTGRDLAQKGRFQRTLYRGREKEPSPLTPTGITCW
jgi:hypothetical protein